MLRLADHGIRDSFANLENVWTLSAKVSMILITTDALVHEHTKILRSGFKVSRLFSYAKEGHLCHVTSGQNYVYTCCGKNVIHFQLSKSGLAIICFCYGLALAHPDDRIIRSKTFCSLIIELDECSRINKDNFAFGSGNYKRIRGRSYPVISIGNKLTFLF